MASNNPPWYDVGVGLSRDIYHTTTVGFIDRKLSLVLKIAPSCTTPHSKNRKFLAGSLAPPRARQRVLSALSDLDLLIAVYGDLRVLFQTKIGMNR